MPLERRQMLAQLGRMAAGMAIVPLVSAGNSEPELVLTEEERQLIITMRQTSPHAWAFMQRMADAVRTLELT